MLDDKINTWRSPWPEADGYDHITRVLTTHNRHKTCVPATHNWQDCHSELQCDYKTECICADTLFPA